jgi:hypothetical protein
MWGNILTHIGVHHTNSTLTSSTYLVILPCLPPSNILYPIWFLQSHMFFLSQYPYNSPLTVLGFWVTCGVKMMPLHHDWACQPPQPLLLTSTFDIYKVFEHIDMLFWGIWQQSWTVIPTLLGSDLGVLGHLWSQNDVNTSWLRLTANSNCFLHPH